MIKRYEVDGYGGYMSECQDYGDYVRYEDHAAEVEALRADAERYRFLRPLLLSCDFQPDDYVGLTFALPVGSKVSANMDATLDAIAARTAKEQP